MTEEEIGAELDAEIRAMDSLAHFLGYWMLQDAHDVYRGSASCATCARARRPRRMPWPPRRRSMTSATSGTARGPQPAHGSAGSHPRPRQQSPHVGAWQ